jgi:HK97 family phage portal protein
MDSFDLWYSAVVFQKLAGAAYYEKERDRAGRVIALWPLRPDWVYPIRSSRAFIAGYEYRIPGKDPITLAPQDVIDFRLFDPLNQYRGYPPAAVAGRVGDVDNATTDYLKAFMEKGGMPPGLLKTKQKLVDNDVTDIRRRWGDRYGGVEHWLQPAVLDQDAEYQKVGLSFQEMGFEVLDARSEARICMVLGVPPILIGAKIGLDRATYSNYAEARLAWWEDTLIPQYSNFESVINNDLVPDFGEDIVTEFDFSDVPALAENEDAVWGRANEGLSRGYVTVNEAREIVGLEAIGPLGDIFLRPLNVVETPLSQLRPFPTEDTPDESPDEETEPPDGANPANESETEEAARYLALEAKARRAPDDAHRREFERQLREKLEPFFADQLIRIENEIGERYQPMRSKNGTANH